MQQRNSGGISVLGLLGVLFVGLKLTGYINWSWWWVTLPFWGGLALVLVIIVIVAAIATICHIELGKPRARFPHRGW